jgi:hypothetical protein
VAKQGSFQDGNGYDCCHCGGDLFSFLKTKKSYLCSCLATKIEDKG